ncbi:MAG: dihydropteroate synthase [Chthoniobacter sp.]|uniref:dihydropteroate synthase n=1 Tax=Chthoniobacter sp. TaxID=2510640 RepID=UPI0032A70684
MKLVLRDVSIEFPVRPLVMGIVNLVADSFSGDGVTDIDAALTRARQQLADGADIIDIGAESARTNRGPIPEEEEAAQLRRFIERWPELREDRPTGTPSPLLSINAWRPGVIRQVLPRGGELLNDISGLPTDENARLCADSGAALLIMHTVGEPKVAHTHVGYDDIMARLEEFFAAKIALAERAGVAREAILLDPGIDFAKQRGDNLRIYRELDRLHQFGRPILLPVSRKTVIGEVLGLPNAAERDAGTVACIVQGMLRGAHIFRVHHVRAAAQAVRIIAAVEGAG